MGTPALSERKHFGGIISHPEGGVDAVFQKISASL
jgi:hypothetical protein